jgi:hypothetical protein
MIVKLFQKKSALKNTYFLMIGKVKVHIPNISRKLNVMVFQIMRETVGSNRP